MSTGECYLITDPRLVLANNKHIQLSSSVDESYFELDKIFYLKTTFLVVIFFLISC